MPIALNDLTGAASRAYRVRLSRSLLEARAQREATAFLSHSHRDKDYAKGLQVLLKEQGWSVYLDWEDQGMPEEPNRETAAAVQRKISEMDWFLFLATPNSVTSKWCPWEIGFADKAKGGERVLVVTTTDTSGRHYGREYLQLYRQITPADSGDLAAFPAGARTGGILVRSL
jgi:hypothetical protein